MPKFLPVVDNHKMNFSLNFQFDILTLHKVIYKRMKIEIFELPIWGAFLGGGRPKTMQFLSLLRLIFCPNFKEKTQFGQELSTEEKTYKKYIFILGRFP